MAVYTCAICGSTYNDDNEAQAVAEAEALWAVPDADTREDFTAICDICFNRRIEPQRAAIGQAFKESEYYRKVIEDLLRTKQYEWCRGTLKGISNTIQKNGQVTLRQKEAVEHIIAGSLKHDVGPV